MKTKTLKWLLVCLSVLLVAECVLAIYLERSPRPGVQTDRETIEELRWQPDKHPNEYTWEEYESLSPAEKEQFFDHFSSVEAFDAWLNRVSPNMETDYEAPWEKTGVCPEDYTWEEYEALSPAQKELFFDSFGSADTFDAWMKENGPGPENDRELPWEIEGKRPEEYTWAEYEALSPAQKELFYDSFGSMEAFDAWLEAATAKANSDLPWENGGKLPSEYTKEEYEALNHEQQAAFAAWFGTVEEFDAWIEKVYAETDITYPWEIAGKRPEEYTWAEYQALSPSEKEHFFDCFESVEAFDAWMSAAQAAHEDSTEPGKKKPQDYTWEEYEAMSPSEKEQFFDSFESVEAFKEWMDRVNPS